MFVIRELRTLTMLLLPVNMVTFDHHALHTLVRTQASTRKKNMCFVPVVVIPWMLFTFQSHISDVWSERKWCAHLPQIKKKITEEKLMFRGKKRQIWFAIYLWVVEYKLMLANEFMERGWWDESTMALLLQQNLTHREWKRVFAINGRTFNWMV